MILLKLLILIFYFFYPIFNYAEATTLTVEQLHEWRIEEHASLLTSSPQCGKIYVLDENFVEQRFSRDTRPSFLSLRGTPLRKVRRKFPAFKPQETQEASFRAPDAKLFLTDPLFKHWQPKQIHKQLNWFLLEAVQKRVYLRLAAEFEAFAPLDSQLITTFLQQAEATLFRQPAQGLEVHPQRRLRLFFTLYPELISEILSQEDDDLKPLLCPFQQHEHEVKLIRRWSQVLAIPAAGLGISAIVVGSMGLVIPGLAIAAGISACTLGIKDISFGVRDLWHKEKAAYVAHKIRWLGRELKKTLAHLKSKQSRTRLSAEEAQLLSYLQKFQDSPSKQRQETLTAVCRSQFGNRLLIAFGLLNIGFNSLNLTGDPTLLANLPGQVFKSLGIL